MALTRAGGDARRLGGPLEGVGEPDPLALAERLHHRLGALADAALGGVEDAAQGHLVVGVRQGAQVGDRVADLAALVEAGAADHAVGQAHPDEDLLDRPRLRVGPVEDRDVRGLETLLVGQAVDLVRDERRLVVLVVGDVRHDRAARAGIGPEPLLAPAGVARDDGVRRREDRLGRPVVLLEHDRRGVRVVALELLDVADGGAAERVDGLVGVADDAQLPGRQRLGRGADELLDEDVLRVVGVLVLVDEHVPEPAAVVLGDVGEELQHGHRARDEVVEVEGVGASQAPLVLAVRLGQQPFHVVGRAARVRLVVDQLVLQVGHLPEERARGELLRVQAHVAHDHRHEAQGVGLVVDGEAALHVQPRGLRPQDADAGAVERRHPHGPGAGADELAHALLHLAGGLVREGDGEDLAGLRVTGREQVGDAAGQDPGLARSGPRHDEQRAAPVLDRRPLGGVEVLDEPGDRWGGRLARLEGQLAVVGRTHPRILGRPSDAPSELTQHPGELCRVAPVPGQLPLT